MLESFKDLIWFKYLVLKVFPVSPTGFLFHVVFSRNCGLVDYPLCLAFSGEPAGVYLADVKVAVRPKNVMDFCSLITFYG